MRDGGVAADAIRAEALAAFEARAALAEEHARLFVDDRRRRGAVAERVNRGSMGSAPPSPYCAPSPYFIQHPLDGGAEPRPRSAASLRTPGFQTPGWSR